MELKLPLLKADDDDDDDGDKIVIDTSHEITYGDLGETGGWLGRLIQRVMGRGGTPKWLISTI